MKPDQSDLSHAHRLTVPTCSNMAEMTLLLLLLQNTEVRLTKIVTCTCTIIVIVIIITDYTIFMRLQSTTGMMLPSPRPSLSCTEQVVIRHHFSMRNSLNIVNG